MSVKHWLSEQLKGLNSVRTCAIDREASIVVYTWGGTVINIYLINEPIKPRAIKRLVQDNTRVGVGTLFSVSVDRSRRWRKSAAGRIAPHAARENSGSANR